MHRGDTTLHTREQIIVFSQPGALPQNALEQIVEKAKTLDMEEVRKQIAQEGAGASQEGAPPAAA